MTKIIKEMLPPDVRVARDAQDLLIECCVGENVLPFSLYILTFYVLALCWFPVQLLMAVLVLLFFQQ